MSSTGGPPSWQAIVSVRNFHRSRPGPDRRPRTLRGIPVIATPQVTALIHDFAVSLGSGTWARRSRRYWLRQPGVGEDVIGGRVSLVAGDGEREDFRRSARALPASRRHAGHITCLYLTCDMIGGLEVGRLADLRFLLSCWADLRTHRGLQSGPVPYVRAVKAASGASAVQIVYSSRRGSREIRISARPRCACNLLR
jgi:hypothetical protein